MTIPHDLEREIVQLSEIIKADQAALRMATVSDADKVQLCQALDERRARLAVLQEQLLAGLPKPD
jgi:hypothetical protein